MKTIYPSHSGFSLVEVLVSITILLMVIVGPMSMISRANNSTSFATEQINAWFLAQEGLELIEKQRDDYLLQYFKDKVSGNPNPWADFTDESASGKLKSCYLGTGCDVLIASDSTPTVTVTDCATVANCRLALNTSTSVRQNYTHSGTDSLFTRVITLQKITANQVRVTATVTWRTGTLIASQKVVATTYLFNIYDTP